MPEMALVVAVDDAAATDGAVVESGLSSYIRNRFEEACRFRQTNGINDKLLEALRAVRGEYDAATLAQIKKFGGSKIYARLTANKVRSVAAFLREIYTSVDRPWGLRASGAPDLPGGPMGAEVMQKVAEKLTQAQQLGVQFSSDDMLQMLSDIRTEVLQARQEIASRSAQTREDELDGVLQGGGFYAALWDFLLDLATYPFAVIKGPVVRYTKRIEWKNGDAVVTNDPHLHWEECSPFDVFFAPWSRTPQDGYVIHYQTITRPALQDLRSMRSYHADAIDAVLDMSAESFMEWHQYVDSERGQLEKRDTDGTHVQGAVDQPYPMLEFHGYVSTELMRSWGMSEAEAPSGAPDVSVVVFLIGTHVIGAYKNPHPLDRLPFYAASYESVPGSIYGLAVPGILEDVARASNAVLRSLVNNVAIASGPQVGVNTDRMGDGAANVTLYPWKVWGFTEQLGLTDSKPPVQFFQPQSNAQELFGVYSQLVSMADVLSGMPRMSQGDMQGVATMGRSASGLSMALDAANRVMKQVVMSVDGNILQPLIEDLNAYMTVMGMNQSEVTDMRVVARGASELIQRQALQQKRVAFLQLTGNPIDMQLIGANGRYEVLRAVAADLELPESKVFSGVTESTKRGVAQALAAQQGSQQAPAQQVPGDAAPPGTEPGLPPQAVPSQAAPPTPPVAPQTLPSGAPQASPQASPAAIPPPAPPQ